MKHLEVFIIRDKLNASQNYTLLTRIHRFHDLSVMKEEVKYFVVEPNTVHMAGTIDIYDMLRKDSLDPTEHFVKLILRHVGDSNTLSRDYILLTEPKNCRNLGNPKLEHKIATQQCKHDHSVVSIELRIQRPALFVYLEVTNPNITDYTFSSNGFIQVEPIKVVNLEFKNINCSSVFEENNIEIMTVNDYMQKG